MLSFRLSILVIALLSVTSVLCAPIPHRDLTTERDSFTAERSVRSHVDASLDIVHRQDSGSCTEGQITCTSESTWSMCGSGYVQNMGSVAAGMKCENGAIVASGSSGDGSSDSSTPTSTTSASAASSSTGSSDSTTSDGAATRRGIHDGDVSPGDVDDHGRRPADLPYLFPIYMYQDDELSLKIPDNLELQRDTEPEGKSNS
ncbi:hypothetical protein FISHEDRAFT_56726 [Fistulina hepatica ATCC 64428]|uniref:Carbohydrate-binding module family 19 domain-containing protein n=1 Tax=Fistulina hepatica ATCC 64428 TaxID=1128425 RepID=A0A0D7AHX9_9AGAR|nr:hypothetical protein FISHEDRAFT_56726 [Fistulina hepatica ATCC 64428]